MKNLSFICIFLLHYSGPAITRGPLHFTDQTAPTITTQWRWKDSEAKNIYSNLDLRKHHFSNKTITEFPLFKTFDFKEMQQYALPETKIRYRNDPSKTISGKKLAEIIEKFFNEVLAKQSTYTDFIVLKKADFNLKKQAGLLIVKAKNYPFVVKLFMETPRSFLRPYNKGIIPLLQFGINGGATRHLVGFTRIKNSKTIIKMLDESPWKGKVDVPRKWYWIPKNYPWIFLTTHNLGKNNPVQSILLPGAYILVADYIDAERPFSITCAQDRQDALNISNYVECRVDPHIQNFLHEKNTGKIVLIDTEHFPTLGGLQKKPYVTSYSQLYVDMAFTYLRRHFFSLKKDRIARQASGGAPFCTP